MFVRVCPCLSVFVGIHRSLSEFIEVCRNSSKFIGKRHRTVGKRHRTVGKRHRAVGVGTRSSTTVYHQGPYHVAPHPLPRLPHHHPLPRLPGQHGVQHGYTVTTGSPGFFWLQRVTHATRSFQQN